MNVLPDGRQSRGSVSLLAVAALGCIYLLAVRLDQLLRSGAIIATSGFEHEPLFSIWKRVHHLPVYPNPFSPPFAQSYFNYLFYEIFGSTALAFQRALHVSDLQLPVIVRLITLAFGLVLGVVAYRLMRVSSGIGRTEGALLTVTICAGTLPGWWLITARPDIAGIAFEIAGVLCILMADKSGRRTWVLCAIALFYGAWAFKQPLVDGWLACIAFYLFQKRWRDAILLVSLPAVLFAATLALGSDAYRFAVLGSQIHRVFTLAHVLYVLQAALSKAPLSVAGLVISVAELYRWRNSTVRVLALATFISFVLAVLQTGVTGAGDNRFLGFNAFGSMVCAGWLARHFDTLDWKNLLVKFGLAAQIICLIAVMAGKAGKIRTDEYPQLLTLQKSIERFGGPALVTEPMGDLPWFQPAPPYFVLSGTYFDDKARGAPYEYGGAGEMVKTGKIHLLVVPRDVALTSFDGVELNELQEVGEDKNWIFFSASRRRN